MNNRALGTMQLRLRLLLLRTHPLTLAAAVLFVAVAGTLAWMLSAVWSQEAARERRPAQAPQAVAASTPVPAQAGVPAPDNLARFYAALGQRRDAEQQVKTLFGLAAQNGLTLAQGEYKGGYDRNAQVYTYQINLPVKGRYQAIWQFATGALRAIPFASLDEIGFQRDTIGDPQVQARLRLTLYLTERRTDVDHGAGGVQ